MYKETEGSTLEVIADLPCHIPQEGYIYVNGKRHNIGVYKRSRYKEEQYWELDPRWKEYANWKAEQDTRQKTDKSYSHPKLVEFINECWLYRLGGFWFYNNGVPTYITGKYWFYLNCIHLDTGLPRYREMDRQFFNVWQYSQEDPNSMGVLYLTKRRSGKSYIGGTLSIEYATRLKQFNAGIQSKTETDAKKAFKKCVIMPYRQLPYFFKVAKTNMTTKVPEKELLFRDNKGDSDFDDELSSRIDFAASGEGAYDGQKLGYYFADEVFKPQEVNVAERWSVVQFCLKDYDGSIIGKTLHTTTVEDMKSGNKVAMNMWKGSNPANKEEGANKTATGMYRFFVAGHKVRCLDKYGFADELKAREEIMMERKAKEKDPRELSGLIRKDPMSIEEAFYTDSEQCVFNPMLLTERENELKFSETAFIRGEFVWKDEKWGDVRFVQNPQGNIMLSKRFKMPQDLENRHTIRNGLRAPANNHVFAMGVDPYDHKIEINRTNERYLSKGSFAVVHKESGGHNIGDLANGVVCFYKFRHVNPDDFYSDAIKTMIYFGCDALIERDKPGLIRHMEKMRLQEYATRLSGQQQRGIKASRENTNGACELLDQYINDNIGYVDFIELVEEWKAFDPSDTTEFDGTMAMLYALLLLDMRKPKRTISKGGVKDIKELFSFWKATRR